MKKHLLGIFAGFILPVLCIWPCRAAVTMNENVRGTNNTYFMNVLGSSPSFTVGGSTWTVSATSASVRATAAAGALGNVAAQCIDFGSGNFQCGPANTGTAVTSVTAGYGLTGGGVGAVTLNLNGNTTSYIQNRSTLQSGTTAYPEFLYTSSGTANNFNAATSFLFKGISAVSVYQIAYASTTTDTTSTSVSYADTTLTVSITPKFTTSKILVFAVQSYDSGSASGGTVQLLNGSTVIAAPVGFFASSGDTFGTLTILALDSPATTSAVTYKTQFNRQVGSGTVHVQPNNNGSLMLSQIIAIELSF